MSINSITCGMVQMYAQQCLLNVMQADETNGQDDATTGDDIEAADLGDAGVNGLGNMLDVTA